MKNLIKTKIKRGALVGQERRYFNWPGCIPPSKEYDLPINFKYETKFPDAIFECEWNGEYWDCKRDGYGSLKYSESYGNGSIFVFDFNGIEFLSINDEGDWW